MFDLIDIQNRVQSGQPVTEQEYAFLLRNNKAAFLAFLAGNNPGNANDILRHQLGYTELGFAPDVPKISRILGMMLDKGELKELNYFVNNFKLDEGKITPELQKELIGLFQRDDLIDLSGANQRTFGDFMQDAVMRSAGF